MNDTDSIPALVEKFPRLFHGKPPLVHSELPPGWEALVTRLLVDLDKTLNDSQARRFQIRQIKEKVAGLRFYWQLDAEETETETATETLTEDWVGAQSTDRVDAEPVEPMSAFDWIAARVLQAGEESEQTCQGCGEPGDVGPGHGGVATLCAACCQQRAEAQ